MTYVSVSAYHCDYDIVCVKKDKEHDLNHNINMNMVLTPFSHKNPVEEDKEHEPQHQLAHGSDTLVTPTSTL